MRGPASLAVIVLTCCAAAVGLAQTKPWDSTFGGSDEDRGGVVRQTSDGGYIVGGVSLSPASGDKTQDGRGGVDYWIVKVDTNGLKQWDRTFGGSSGDWFSDIEPTQDGGCIIGGASASPTSSEKTEETRGGFDYWILKVDPNGLKQWDRTFGGNRDDYLYRVRQTRDGGYILAGYSESPVSGDKTQPSQGVNDYWLVKVDANGVKQWDRTLGGSGADTAYDMWETPNGGYVVGGASDSPVSGDKTQPSQGGNDYWVVAVDSNGVKQWDRTYGGSDQDELSCLRPASDGGYCLGGYSISPAGGDKTQPSQGFYDYWLVSIESNGVKRWDRTIGGAASDKLLCMESTADGGYVLGGYSSSPVSGDKSQPSRGVTNTIGSIDFWLVKVDRNGGKQWDRTFGGTGLESLVSVQVSGDNTFVLGGWSDSPLGGDKTQASRGSYDYWLLKFRYAPGFIMSVR
jgi:hypothetical protein